MVYHIKEGDENALGDVGAGELSAAGETQTPQLKSLDLLET